MTGAARTDTADEETTMATFTGDTDFDVQLARTLSAATRGCADLGEALATADRVVAGDLGSWAREWTATADAVLAEGDASLAEDQTVSARRCYLRASEYYRQAFFYLREDLDGADLHAAYKAHVGAFRAALPLLPGATEVMDLEAGDVVARGYLLRPDGSGTRRPTILAPAGYDSTAEAGYVAAAVDALERGLYCLVFEGPGQGGVLYEHRRYLRPDFEAVLTPVVDWLLTRDGVDPDRLALLGRSFAGYLAPRGATGEHRLAALVCDPAQYDLGAAARARTGEETWRRLERHDPTLEADLAPMIAEPRQRNAFRSRMASHGLDALTDYLREISRFTLVGRAEKITCPTLALAGEGDFAGTGQLDVFAAALRSPVTTHRFTRAEGAGGHCEGLGQDRFARVVHDWIAAVLSTR